MSSFLKVLKLDFLTNKRSSATWLMIIYLSFLIILMIVSGHLVDIKTYRIESLNEQVRNLKTELINEQIELLEIKELPLSIDIKGEKSISPSQASPIRIQIENQEL